MNIELSKQSLHMKSHSLECAHVFSFLDFRCELKHLRKQCWSQFRLQSPNIGQLGLFK